MDLLPSPDVELLDVRMKLKLAILLHAYCALLRAKHFTVSTTVIFVVLNNLMKSVSSLFET